MYLVYILKSEKDSHTYVGYTNNLVRRIAEHNSGQAISTRYRHPLKLILSEKFTDERSAKIRELYWKSGAGRRKLKELFQK